MVNVRTALTRPDRHRGRKGAEIGAALVVAVLSAGLAGSVRLAWWAPVGLLVGVVVVVAAVWWIVLLAKRDSRALLVLWLVFALNRSLALVLPGALGTLAQSLDDISLGIALVVVLATHRRTRRRAPRAPVFYAGMSLYGVSGVVSAMAGGIIAPAVVLGTWLALKMLVAVYVCAQFSWTDRQIRRAFVILCWLTVVVVAVALLQVEFPGAVSAFFGSTERQRLGATVVTSIFPEPAQYSAFAMLSIIVVLTRYPLSKGRVWAAALLGAAALLSLRLKALVDVVLVLTARAVTSPARTVRASAPLIAGIVGGAAAYFGAGLIAARSGVLFGNDASPRQLLYAVASQLATINAPLGGGFGSFASEASITYYSPVYERFGLSDTYGFTPQNPAFAHDASWATVLGEAGWLGVLGVAAALVALGWAFWMRLRSRQAGYRADCARAGLLFTLVIASDSVTTPQIFAGFTVVSLGMLWSMAFSEAGNEGAEVAVDSSVPSTGEASAMAAHPSAGTEVRR